MAVTLDDAMAKADRMIEQGKVENARIASREARHRNLVFAECGDIARELVDWTITRTFVTNDERAGWRPRLRLFLTNADGKTKEVWAYLDLDYGMTSFGPYEND